MGAGDDARRVLAPADERDPGDRAVAAAGATHGRGGGGLATSGAARADPAGERSAGVAREEGAQTAADGNGGTSARTATFAASIAASDAGLPITGPATGRRIEARPTAPHGRWDSSG